MVKTTVFPFFLNRVGPTPSYEKKKFKNKFYDYLAIESQDLTFVYVLDNSSMK